MMNIESDSFNKINKIFLKHSSEGNDYTNLTARFQFLTKSQRMSSSYTAAASSVVVVVSHKK